MKTVDMVDANGPIAVRGWASDIKWSSSQISGNLLVSKGKCRWDMAFSWVPIEFSAESEDEAKGSALMLARNRLRLALQEVEAALHLTGWGHDWQTADGEKLRTWRCNKCGKTIQLEYCHKPSSFIRGLRCVGLEDRNDEIR